MSTVLLDIEQGSVGGALGLFSPGAKPRLFGETRFALPVQQSRDTSSLVAAVKKGIHEVLARVHTTAARLRNHPQVSSMGSVTGASLFLSAPWGTPNLAEGASQFDPHLQDFLTNEIGSFAPEVPVSFHTGADAAAYALQVLYPDTNILLCMVGGEVAELLLVGSEGARGYATIPHGSNSFLRTLRAHGGISQAQAESLFSLDEMPQHYEPLSAAARHFTREFAAAAEQLLAQDHVAGVVLVSRGNKGEWIAKNLGGMHGEDALSALFPQGGVVQALGAHHLAPHIDAYGSAPDLSLMLGGLFVGDSFI